MPNDQIFRADRKYALRVCARLRAFRTEVGHAAPDVAEYLEIPTALYAHYEDYELVPHQLIPRLCELLNFSPWHYLTGMSDENSPPIQSNRRRNFGKHMGQINETND